VKSPEKLKKALVDMNDQVQVNKTEINDSTSKYRQLQGKSAALEKIDNVR
jgi:hypothetical protein